MNAAIQAHVVADEYHLRSRELRGEIQGMKAAIAAPANLSGLCEQDIVSSPNALDLFDAGEFSRRICVLRKLLPLKIWNAAVRLPPCVIAGVKRVCPRRELP